MARKITAIAPHKSFEFQRKKVVAYARVSSGKDVMLHSRRHRSVITVK